MNFKKTLKEKSICQFIIYKTKKRQVSEPVQTKARKWDCPLGRLATTMLHQNHREFNVQDIIVFVFSNNNKFFLFALYCSQVGRALLALLPGTTHTAMPHRWRANEIFKHFQTSHVKISVCSSASHYTKLGFFPVYLDNLSAIKEI